MYDRSAWNFLRGYPLRRFEWAVGFQGKSESWPFGMIAADDHRPSLSERRV
jgi:hypothetical protein